MVQSNSRFITFYSKLTHPDFIVIARRYTASRPPVISDTRPVIETCSNPVATDHKRSIPRPSSTRTITVNAPHRTLTLSLMICGIET